MSVLLCLGAIILLQNFMPGGSMHHGIIGGRESDPKSHPYMVYLQNWKTKESCDGFLVHKNFVMTAAHCNGHIVAFLGLHSTKGKHIRNSTWVKAYPHPEYNETNYKNDIMLLKLQKPAEFNEKVMPIALPYSKKQNFTHNCLVKGWGCQSFENNDPSEVLREVNVTISNNSYCKGPDVICSQGNKGPGKGDSGGPLVCGDIAYGIVSTCIKTTAEPVAKYTRIAHYLNWIYSVFNGTFENRKVQADELDLI